MSSQGQDDSLQRAEICEIGRRMYDKGFVAAMEGNLSCRLSPQEFLCTPTMICKGRMSPEDLCVVDGTGQRLSGSRARTSEILLHLEIYRHRPDVQAVVHAHPPHATAFALTRQPLPRGISAEVEVFLGPVPLAPYDTPGSQTFAKTVVPFLSGTSAILLSNHGTVTFGKTLEEAFWRTEILEAHCRTVLLSRSLGNPVPLSPDHIRELLDLKKRLGYDDPRFHDP
ncbi:class II aldolase/adducin family protein [Planctomicrobium sp. SH664]|uniref:class II aldolase/adducin family protein n=1 Tax=Planctomicrobium sp. SH664 TaxID=3448125 RepID=UPI003F5CACFE